LIRIRHTLRFVIALYLLYGWVYYLVVHAHVSVYMYYFALFFFPLWILYEDIFDYLEFRDALTNLVINLFLASRTLFPLLYAVSLHLLLFDVCLRFSVCPVRCYH